MGWKNTFAVRTYNTVGEEHTRYVKAPSMEIARQIVRTQLGSGWKIESEKS